MIRLIFTADYEVFGNGSGDPETCLIHPTADLLDICTQHQVPLTLFVDVCEYWAFKHEEETGRLPPGYRPASLIEDQLLQAVASGHDIQLHFHPQWLDYKFSGSGDWEVNLAYWRLPDVEGMVDGSGNKISLSALFERGKATLENLITPFDPSYECLAFRAGAWSIQPERSVLQAMRMSGLRIDSTVAPGLYNHGNLSRYDFRQTPSKPFWTIGDSVTEEDSNGDLFEVPIRTHKFDFFATDWAARIIRRRKAWSALPKNCSGSIADSGLPKKNVLDLIRSLIQTDRKMFDYCSLTGREMRSLVNSSIREASSLTDVPIVAIGHPKSFNNRSALEFFFKSTADWRDAGLMDYSTYRELRSLIL